MILEQVLELGTLGRITEIRRHARCTTPPLRGNLVDYCREIILQPVPVLVTERRIRKCSTHHAERLPRSQLLAQCKLMNDFKQIRVVYVPDSICAGVFEPGVVQLESKFDDVIQEVITSILNGDS